jgi:hypothetical protein
MWRNNWMMMSWWEIVDDQDNDVCHHLEQVEYQLVTLEDHQLNDEHRDKEHALVVGDRNY